VFILEILNSIVITDLLLSLTSVKTSFDMTLFTLLEPIREITGMIPMSEVEGCNPPSLTGE